MKMKAQSKTKGTKCLKDPKGRAHSTFIENTWTCRMGMVPVKREAVYWSKTAVNGVDFSVDHGSLGPCGQC